MKTSLSGGLRLFFLSILAAMAFSSTSLAQSGSGSGEVTGIVANAATKASLEGATVELLGMNRRTLTDSSGAFSFYKLPPGSYTVSVGYPGLDVQTRNISVAPGSRVAADFSLTSEIYALSAFLVTSEREGNAAAILRQRNSGNIVNVVAIDAFGDIADGNLGNFMQRLPGVATQVAEGDVVGIALRGAPPQMGMTMLNGSRLSGAAAGDTGKVGDRASLIDRIPSEFIKEVEVTKASTPDMDAAGLGGATRLITKSAFDFRENMVTSFQAGYNRNIYREENPWTPTGAFTVMSKLGSNNKLGLTLSGSYTATIVTRDQVEQTHPVVENLTTGVRFLDDTYNRRRAGLGGKLEFRPTESLSLFVDALYSAYTSNTDRYDFQTSQATGFLVADYGIVSRAAIEGGAVPLTTTRANAGLAPGATGQFVEVLNATATNRSGLDMRQDKAYHFSIGGKKKWGDTELSSRISSSFNKYDRKFDTFTATLPRLGFTIDQRQNNGLPLLAQTYGPSYRNLNNYTAQYGEAYQKHRDTLEGLELDLQRRLNQENFTLRLKGGVKFTREKRTSDSYTVNWNAVGADGIQGANPATGLNDDNLQQFAVTDGYGMFDGYYPNFAGIDSGIIHRVHGGGPGYFQLRGAQTHNPKSEADEEIHAAYALGEFTKGRLNVLAGVRGERTSLEAIGNLTGSGAVRRTEREGEYTKYFPSVHARYSLRPNFNLRGSYSTTMARPSISDLIPSTTVSSTGSGTVSQNNSNLGPQYSKNYDLMVEYYFAQVGVISAGVFRKEITGFIAAYQDVVPFGPDNGFGGEFGGYLFATKRNINTAELEGYELNYDQQLRFLPKPFNTLAIFANYSSVKNQGIYNEGAAALSGFIPSTFNVGFNYSFWRLQLRADYNHTGAYLFGGYNVDPVRMNMSSSVEKVNLNLQYKINPHLNASMNIANVFDSWPHLYSLTPNRITGYDRYGTRITFGITGRY